MAHPRTVKDLEELMYLESVLNPKNPKNELRQLEQEIAYHAARSDIECGCKGKRQPRERVLWWYDTESAESGEEQEGVSMAGRYLELRGLLKRNPENPALVQPLDAE